MYINKRQKCKYVFNIDLNIAKFYARGAKSIAFLILTYFCFDKSRSLLKLNVSLK